jgi:hypothetical protein
MRRYLIAILFISATASLAQQTAKHGKAKRVGPLSAIFYPGYAMNVITNTVFRHMQRTTFYPLF